MTSDEIIQILKDKQATKPCPACGHDGFTLVDGDFTQESTGWGRTLLTGAGRRSLDYIVLGCDNCGYLRQHAMKPLGITPKYRRI